MEHRGDFLFSWLWVYCLSRYEQILGSSNLGFRGQCCLGAGYSFLRMFIWSWFTGTDPVNHSPGAGRPCAGSQVWAMAGLQQVRSARSLRGCVSSPAFGLSPEPELCVPELACFLGASTSAPLRRHGQSFLRVSGPLDLLHPSLLPGHPALLRWGPGDPLVIWLNGQDPGSTRDNRQLAWRLGAHALGGVRFQACRALPKWSLAPL